MDVNEAVDEYSAARMLGLSRLLCDRQWPSIHQKNADLR
jgi:hypothetical protein